VVGTVGVISRRKGSDLFVEAARRLLRDGAEIEFRMIGAPADVLDREWAAGILARAADAGIDHKLEADAPAEMRGWDVFVLPSRFDPFPTATLEAMASALPVVATEVDGLAEQVTPETGKLVPADDADALAAAILAMQRSPAERIRLGANGRKRVMREFTLERQADGLAAAYREALGS
jgi:glycosyltransferase involved in cell wall biosynthesis